MILRNTLQRITVENLCSGSIRSYRDGGDLRLLQSTHCSQYNGDCFVERSLDSQLFTTQPLGAQLEGWRFANALIAGSMLYIGDTSSRDLHGGATLSSFTNIGSRVSVTWGIIVRGTILSCVSLG